MVTWTVSSVRMHSHGRIVRGACGSCPKKFVFHVLVFRTGSAHCKIKFGSDSATALPDPFGTLALDSRKKRRFGSQIVKCFILCKDNAVLHNTRHVKRARERELFIRESTWRLHSCGNCLAMPAGRSMVRASRRTRNCQGLDHVG